MYGYNPFMVFGFGYIKKEDARLLITSRQIMAWVIGGCMLVMLLAMHYFVQPKMIDIYEDLKYEVPLFAQYDLPIGFLLSFIAMYLSYPSTSFKESFEKNLRKHKAGEMIMIRNLISGGQDFIVMGVVFLCIVLFLVSYILPIYDLTIII